MGLDVGEQTLMPDLEEALLIHSWPLNVRGEEAVSAPHDRVSSTGQGGELLAEGQVLDHKVAARAQGRAVRRQKGTRR